MGRNPQLALAAGLWLLVMAVALLTRPFLPVDETRYLAVAWDMWLDGHYLVPHLNGEPYSHKPPLLFWLINAGWAAFGVNDWWPRLVAPLFGLGCLFLTAHLADRLWPGRAGAGANAALVLFGGSFWALFTTLTMFDMILAFCALVALIGLVDAWRGRRAGFVVFGLGIGLGVLAKGPAILVHVLPAAVLAPLWGPALGRDAAAGAVNWGRWAGGVLAGIALGAAIGLAWAVPAGMAGGAEYRDAIFWGQSAGRMVDSFAHREPVWFYAAAFPVMLLPWLVWPPAWRGLGAWSRGEAGGGGRADGGLRFGLAWVVPALVVFSAISGKQFHYLLPELPAVALVLARLVFGAEGDAGEPVRFKHLDPLPPAALMAAFGLTVALFFQLPLGENAHQRFAEADVRWGWLLVGAAVLAAFSGRLSPAAATGALSALGAVFVTALHLALAPVLSAAYDLTPIATRLAEIERSGTAIANFTTYHGQYHFLGRLTKPIAVIGLRAGDEERFIAENPAGRVVATHDTLPSEALPEAVFRFRNRILAIWTVDTLKRHPGIADR